MLPLVRDIGRMLRREGGELEILTTGRANHATELATAIPADVEVVLVVGGDGTVCEVINGLPRRGLPIVILRTGTENLLARELRMPTEPIDVARTLLHGESHSLDVGLINGRRFVAVAGVGFDAECVQRMNRVRRGHITHADYFWPIWRTFWAHRFPALRVEADGECVFEGRGLALIGIIAQYSGGLRILSQARFDDGLLDLCVFACSSRLELIGHAQRAFRRRHIGSRGVLYRQVTSVHIDSPDPVLLEVDGEEAGHLPARCEVEARSVCYLRLRPAATPAAPRGGVPVWYNSALARLADWLIGRSPKPPSESAKKRRISLTGC